VNDLRREISSIAAIERSTEQQREGKAECAQESIHQKLRHQLLPVPGLIGAKHNPYHCSGTKWYGKTKEGEYMTEAAAKAADDHADHGMACS